MSDTLETFIARIDSLDLRDGLKGWPAPLRTRESGPWATWYAPFEHVNARARLVIVGITPGLQQAANALSAYQSARRRDEAHEVALASAKVFASFSGPMRANLIALLDGIGVASLLGLDSCARLFADRADLVHFTSALRFPVTLGGKNYGGTPTSLARTTRVANSRKVFCQRQRRCAAHSGCRSARRSPRRSPRLPRVAYSRRGTCSPACPIPPAPMPNVSPTSSVARRTRSSRAR